jgi:hypothetical protein
MEQSLNSHWVKLVRSSLFDDAFPVTRVYSISGRVISEWWRIGKVLVVSSRGLFQGTIPVFAWWGWGKPQKKPRSWYPVSGPRFEVEASRIRSRVLSTRHDVRCHWIKKSHSPLLWKLLDHCIVHITRPPTLSWSRWIQSIFSESIHVTMYFSANIPFHSSFNKISIAIYFLTNIRLFLQWPFCSSVGI